MWFYDINPMNNTQTETHMDKALPNNDPLREKSPKIETSER